MSNETVLTDADKDNFVSDLVDYGTDFVAPLYAVVESIEQAALQSPEVQVRQWQPIETAPHGETVLLGWRDWDGDWIAEVGPATWGWRTDSVSNMSAHGQATHWMPLPAPPADAAMEKHK